MKTFTILLSTLTVLLASAFNLFAKSGPIIIAVDGLALEELGPEGFEVADVSKYFKEKNREDPGYLGINLHNSKYYKQMDAEMKIYDWQKTGERDPGKTSLIVPDLKKNILQAHEEAKNYNRPLVIVGHSWGSVLAYKALKELDDESKNDRTKVVKVDSFVTMGSPLNLRSELREAVTSPKNQYDKLLSIYFQEAVRNLPSNITKPNNINQWTNIHADGDYFSNSINIDGVKDINIGGEKVKYEGTAWSLGQVLGSTQVWHAEYYQDARRPIFYKEIEEGIEKEFTINKKEGKYEFTLKNKDEKKEGISDKVVSSNGKGEKKITLEKELNKPTAKSLEQYEKMDRKELRKELEKKLGHPLEAKYDKMSKRELISALTGVPKEQIHTSDKGKDQGKSLDDYEKMSKGDLRKEMEEKFGKSDKYEKMSQREMISALTGVPKDQIHASKDKDEKELSKKLDHYDKMSKRELRQELGKKQGHNDKYDKMSKRELISALTGIPKDKIDDKKDKEKAKDGTKETKLTKQQVEQIWQARPDVEKDARSHKGTDPYKQTEKWWDKYGQQEMKDFFAARGASSPSSPQAQQNPVNKLSREQVEEIWKTRPDVDKDAHAHKDDPYKRTQRWWEKYGRQEMPAYQFGGTTAPSSPAPSQTTKAPGPNTPGAPPLTVSTPPTTSTSTKHPQTNLSKKEIREIWRARPDVDKDAHAHKDDPYKRTQRWWEKYGRQEMGNYQFQPPPETEKFSPLSTPSQPKASGPSLTPPAGSRQIETPSAKEDVWPPKMDPKASGGSEGQQRHNPEEKWRLETRTGKNPDQGGQPQESVLRWDQEKRQQAQPKLRQPRELPWRQGEHQREHKGPKQMGEPGHQKEFIPKVQIEQQRQIEEKPRQEAERSRQMKLGQESRSQAEQQRPQFQFEQQRPPEKKIRPPRTQMLQQPQMPQQPRTQPSPPPFQPQPRIQQQPRMQPSLPPSQQQPRMQSPGPSSMRQQPRMQPAPPPMRPQPQMQPTPSPRQQPQSQPQSPKKKQP